MIKIRLLTLFLITLICCNKNISENDLLNKKVPFGYYGDKIELKQELGLEKLFDSPDKFLNEEVLISGNITEVCPMRGCWINVKDNNSDLQIRVKVTDGKIVFPLSAVGSSVKVQGVFSKLEFSKEQAVQWKVHLAEEKGELLNPDSVKLVEADLIEYRINGIGAHIFSI